MNINLVFWGPRSFQFDLEMNINIYCMHYIIREDSQEVFNLGLLLDLY